MKAKHIYSHDPALDRSNADALMRALEHTNKTGERNGLPLRDGRQPVMWHLSSLTMLGWEEVAGQLNVNEARAARIALQRGLVAAEGLLDADGRPMTLEFEDTSGGEKTLTMGCAKALFAAWGPAFFQELGLRVVVMSKPDPT